MALLSITSWAEEPPIAQNADLGNVGNGQYPTPNTIGPYGLDSITIRSSGSQWDLQMTDLARHGVTDEVWFGAWFAVEDDRGGTHASAAYFGVSAAEELNVSANDPGKALGFYLRPSDTHPELVHINAAGQSNTLATLDISGLGLTGSSDATTPDPADWFHWEFRVRREANGDLDVAVRINGQHERSTVIAAADDPMEGEPFRWAGIMHNIITTSISSRHRTWTHGLYVDDEMWRGPCLVQTIRPTAQGAHDDWTGTDKIAALGGTPTNTDTIEGVAGDRDTYAMEAFEKVAGAGTILGVALWALAASDGTQVAGALRRDGTDEATDTLDELSGPFGAVSRVLPLDPFESAPWTEESINDTEFGLLGVEE